MSPMKWMFLNLLPLLIIFQIMSLISPKSMVLSNLNYTPKMVNCKISWKW